MKKIPTFDEFINEMEIGSQLFADPKDVNSVNFSSKDLEKLLKSAGMEIEANTADEKKFLDKLVQWTISTRDVLETKDLEYLLSIKNKFPVILEPSYNGSKIAYRGTKIAVSKLAKLNFIKDGNNYIAQNTSIIEKTGKRGYSSFSTDNDIARQFIEEQYYEPEEVSQLKQIPVMVTLQTKNNDLLFNPDFTNLFSKQDVVENEIFIVSPTYKPEQIIFYNPEEFKEAVEDYGLWEEFLEEINGAAELMQKINLL
jgi:hypothetical protein